MLITFGGVYFDPRENICVRVERSLFILAFSALDD